MLNVLHTPTFSKQKNHFQTITDICKELKNCSNCGESKGKVRKVQHGTNRLSYNCYLNPGKSKSTSTNVNPYDTVRSEFINIEMDKNTNENGKGHDVATRAKRLNHMFQEVEVEMSPEMCYQILQKIDHAHWCYLLQNPKPPRPEALIISTIPVPPLALRPTVQMTADKSNEDDMTIKLFEMIRQAQQLVLAKSQGKDPSKIDEQQFLLQLLYNQLINSDSSESNSMSHSFSMTKGILQRLKGKQGRFRGNLSGKRVEHSGRTVISPDPYLEINQVAVPLLIAKELTYPERVTHRNINYLKKLILNGPDNYPGANFVSFGSAQNQSLTTIEDGMINTESERYFLKNNMIKSRLAERLKIGDIVHRHLTNGDIVLFNRQPSLHRQSIMAFRAVVHKDKTLKFNECVCSPFNGDFDGDEMNLHLLQNVPAKVEAKEIMDSACNLLNSKSGEANITLIQDFLTTIYLITSKDFFMDRARFSQLLVMATNGEEGFVIPPPAIFKPVQLWTGKQLFTSLLNTGKGTGLNFQSALKEKYYDSSANKKAFDLDDGYVIVRNGELMCGRIGKNAMGGAKSALLYAIIKRCSSKIAAKVLVRFSRLSARFIESVGVSFTLRDVAPSKGIEEFNGRLFNEKNVDTQKLVDAFFTARKEEVKKQQNARAIISSEEQNDEDLIEVDTEREERAKLENSITSLLNSARDEAGRFLTSVLNPNNNALIMALSGAKGSALNICQMVSTVGQQTVLGNRIQNGFLGRTLPHFLMNDYSPSSRGFVTNSFYTGLLPTEFFFHTMAGREGLIDTAVKTADTGYMQRRLVKVMEDLVVDYDFSVRNSEKKLIQFVYGDDGFDPQLVEAEEFPLQIQNIHHLLENFVPPNVSLDNYMEFLEQKEAASSFEKMREMFKQDLHIITQSALEIENSAKADNAEEICNPSLIDQLFEEHFWKPWKKIFPLQSPNIKFLSTSTEIQKHLAQLSLKQAVSIKEVKFLISKLINYLTKAIINPGEAVGALTAQGLGEPCTQMTLKTFHFAGVASMNVTLGVPRIKEIFNATENIATPIIEIHLNNPDDKTTANFIKNKINAVYLSDILDSFQEVYEKSSVYLLLKFDFRVINSALADVILLVFSYQC